MMIKDGSDHSRTIPKPPPDHADLGDGTSRRAELVEAGLRATPLGLVEAVFAAVEVIAKYGPVDAVLYIDPP
jgi:hypothetical protein